MHTVPDLLVCELRSHERIVSIAEEVLRERERIDLTDAETQSASIPHRFDASPSTIATNPNSKSRS